MKYLNPRSIFIGIITLALGVVVAVGISRVWARQTTTVTGNIAAFMLNPEGKVDGAILDTGDQVRFGPEIGEFVTSNVTIGGSLAATGHAGTNSNYGREFKATSLQIGEQTVTIADRPKGPKDGGPRPPKGDRPRGPKDGGRILPPHEQPDSPDAVKPENQADAAKISGNVKYVIVNRDGNARGLILAGGEQLNLGKDVEDAGLNFDQNTNVSAEGEIMKNQFGAFVRAKVLTVGNQTFTFNR